MNYARIIDGKAVDVCPNPQNRYHPTIAAQFVAVPDDVTPGSVQQGESWQIFTAQPVQPPVVAKKISPVDFKLMFTSAERVFLSAERATDAVLDDFHGLLDDPRLLSVDLSLQTTAEAVDYILALLVAEGLIAEDDVAGRRADIMAGRYR